MKILAIESSCDETAVAVVEDGRTVLSNCVASQIEMHTIYGGVVPEIASRKHVEAITALTDQALAAAGITKKDVDAIAVTYAPGLIGAVLVGVNFAKGAAMSLGLPLVPVHHVRCHIAANYLTLIRGDEDVSAEELLDAHQRIYRSGIPPQAYERFIQIPLHEGEEVRVPTEWKEE